MHSTIRLSGTFAVLLGLIGPHFYPVASAALPQANAPMEIAAPRNNLLRNELEQAAKEASDLTRLQGDLLADGVLRQFISPGDKLSEVEDILKSAGFEPLRRIQDSNPRAEKYDLYVINKLYTHRGLLTTYDHLFVRVYARTVGNDQVVKNYRTYFNRK